MRRTLCENIDWVGYIDWTVRDFHSYTINRGATYNAYLVNDEKPALIDTVKAPYVETLLRAVSELTPLTKVRYVVCNHAEPDHAGGFPAVMEAMPNALVVCNERCARAMAQHFDTSRWKFHIVSDGDTLSIGQRTLQFFDTPMLHWPESMFTYVPENRLLFSMDAFGQHYATANRFDDEVSRDIAMEEAKAYYATIVMPFARQVLMALEKAATLDIDMIAPSHGIIWRSYTKDIVKAYSKWARGYVEPKVVVMYDSMWDSTDAMAKAILDGVTDEGLDAHLIHLRHSDLTQMATEILDAAGVAVGTATLNMGLLPSVAGALTFLKNLKATGKHGFAFGSYGWAAGGTQAVAEYLDDMRWNIVRDPLDVQYRPDAKDLDTCRAAGRLLAAKAREQAQQFVEN